MATGALIEALLTDLLIRTGRLETEMVSQQEKLDADVAALNEAIGNVVTEIAALKAQVEGSNLDFTGLDGAVSALQAATEAVESTEVPPDNG